MPCPPFFTPPAAGESDAVPTAAMKGGDFNGTGAIIYDPGTGNADGSGRTPFPNNTIPLFRIDPAAAYMAKLIPEPNQTVFPNNDLAVNGYRFTRDNVDFKVNYNPTEKFQIFGRYIFSPAEVFDPPSLGAAGGDAVNGGQPGRAPEFTQSAGVGGTYTFTPRVLAGLDRRIHAILGGHGSGASYFNPLAFAPVTDVRFGNSVLTVQFRAECFSVTHTPQFGNPGTTASAMTRNADGSARALNGYTEITSADGSGSRGRRTAGGRGCSPMARFNGNLTECPRENSRTPAKIAPICKSYSSWPVCFRCGHSNRPPTRRNSAGRHRNRRIFRC